MCLFEPADDNKYGFWQHQTVFYPTFWIPAAALIGNHGCHLFNPQPQSPPPHPLPNKMFS